MLVLSRKRNESIVIDDDISVVVVGMIGDKVRLGVEAPQEVSVRRKEVHDAIRRPNDLEEQARVSSQFNRYLNEIGAELDAIDRKSYKKTGEYIEARLKAFFEWRKTKLDAIESEKWWSRNSLRTKEKKILRARG